MNLKKATIPRYCSVNRNSKAGWEADALMLNKRIQNETKKKRKLHQLLFTEMVKFGIIRLTSGMSVFCRIIRLALGCLYFAGLLDSSLGCLYFAGLLDSPLGCIDDFLVH